MIVLPLTLGLIVNAFITWARWDEPEIRKPAIRFWAIIATAVVAAAAYHLLGLT